MWKPIQLEDKPLFDARFKQDPCTLSDYTFTNCWIWDKHRHYSYALLDGCLVIKCLFHGEEVCLMPIGSINEEVLKAISNYPLRAVPEQKVLFLAPHYTECEEESAHFDYLYRYDDLLTLNGNALQAKRNLVHQFEEHYEWSYEPIGKSNLEHVKAMQEKWITIHPGDPSLFEEHHALLKCLDDFEKLHLSGGCLLVDDEVVAYTVGELLTSDTLVIHGEKALPHIKGGYQAINQKFLLHHPKVEWVNREEALGISSLEKAKHSYHPVALLKKFKLSRFRKLSS